MPYAKYSAVDKVKVNGRVLFILKDQNECDCFEGTSSFFVVIRTLFCSMPVIT